MAGSQDRDTSPVIHPARRLVRLLTDGRLVCYNLIIVLLSPLLLTFKLIRLLKKRLGIKEQPEGEFDLARWSCPVMGGEPGHDSHIPQENRLERSQPHVVLVCSGIGELRIVKQLDHALRQIRPQIKTTWVLKNSEAARKVGKAHPTQAVSFVPFDFILPVFTWLCHLSPDVIVFVEKYFYPNLVHCSRDWGAKVMVVSGRPRSYRSLRTRMWDPLHRWILSGLAIICLQTEEHVRRVQHILPRNANVRIAGNIKFGLRPLLNPSLTQELSNWLSDKGDAPVLAAGSTWPREEEFVLRAFQIVRRQAHCVLLIVPRQVDRAQEIVDIITTFGLKASLRTRPVPDADVYVLDTFGELSTAYQFAAAAFIGRTLETVGHDVVEPLVWGIPVSFGPGGEQGKVGPGQRECEAAGVGFRVRSPEELAAHWLAVLQDESHRARIRDSALALVEDGSSGLTKQVDAVVELIDESATMDHREDAPLRAMHPSS
jgi:3-deoxy-D-manno-octulosonic-acid transferase